MGNYFLFLFIIFVVVFLLVKPVNETQKNYAICLGIANFQNLRSSFV